MMGGSKGEEGDWERGESLCLENYQENNKKEKK